MEYTLCPDLAPQPVQSILLELLTDTQMREVLIAQLISLAALDDFVPGEQPIPADSELVCEPTDSELACEAIATLVQMSILSEGERSTFITDAEPHIDFEEGDFVSMDGVILAIMFASDAVIDQLIPLVPLELVSAAISTFSSENQAVARSRFFN